MKPSILAVLLVLSAVYGLPELSRSQAPHQGHDMSSHGAGGMASARSSGTYTQQVVDQGVRAEFQIMSLASMNMKDAGGATHHIMVKFLREDKNEQIRNITGKIRVVSPSGKEQIETLKDYSGMYAANFSFPEKGKYEVVCVIKADDKQHVIKFSYPQS
jgi:hypothetical protein